MTDKELLEMAAKAVGIRLELDGPPESWRPMYYEGKTYYYWNPLTDDGDALRLAVKLGLCVQVIKKYEETQVTWYVGVVLEKHKGKPYEATRRAIVRAAAEIGKAIP